MIPTSRATLTVPCLLDDADALRAEVERLATAVRQVRELHRESNGSMSALYPNPICECGKDYPCQTVRALAEDPK